MRSYNFWTSKENKLNPSRAYEDGFAVVLVYRKEFKTASIYCSPTSSFAFGGKTVGGVAFAGHPKACGSNPRSLVVTPQMADLIWDELLAQVG